MKIIIAGAGEVGSHLAKLLSREEQDIIVVDEDAAKLAVLDANYNLMTVQGSPTSFKILKDVGVKYSDLFIAVTPYEDRNITACSIASYMGARRAVARIDNFELMQPEYKEYFANMGVKNVIYPEYLAAQEIVTALKRGWARHWFELGNGEIILVGVKVRDHAEIVGKSMRELTSQRHTLHVSAIRRGHQTIIPRGDDIIHSNDIVYITTTPEHIEEIREMCGKKQIDISRIMIMGGSRIAARFAALAPKEWKIKIIERDLDRCRKLPELCPECEIIHGDGRDTDLLEDEGIQDCDAFLALTGSAETNILACLTAKEFSVAKTVAEVENVQLIYQAENLNIGVIINKKLLASGKIFQILLDADAESSRFLALPDAEVAEIVVKEGSKITKHPVKDLNLSRDLTLGGLVRDGHGMIVTGSTVFKPGDRVEVFCLSGHIHKIEKLFS
ncbi:MAG: Trk system potassium transporter TrkA [Bacteroidales bacterium]|nr:Trk system potassium transporter TrkA [Bacteroidales bacterium]